MTDKTKENLEKQNRVLQNNLMDLEREMDEMSQRLAAMEELYNQITHSFFWQVTSPLRRFFEWVKKVLARYPRLYDRLRESRRSHSSDSQGTGEASSPGMKWVAGSLSKRRKEERRTHFSREIRFSVLVPLYNTPRRFLRDMISSVRKQTYANWELCLADGSDAEHAYVGRICRLIRLFDKRIVYRKLERNEGISENTNACIELAAGEYLCLLDHDDMLHPSALFRVMQTIEERGADFIYTDENTFHHKPSDAFNPNFKPDFAPDTLRSNNYICHLTAFDRNLLKKAGGGFRKEFDGSQDYDMILRLTEQAKRVEHIPEVLYYWRAHPQSVASSIGAKPYAISAARKAISEHLQRVGLDGEALDSRGSSMYRLKYKIRGEPLVSIVIANKDHVSDLSLCLTSILNKTTYGRYEIIIVENNSTEQETFEYYRSLEEDSRVHVITWKGHFNYSAINNYGVSHAKGSHILLLNNDVKVISPDWIQEMLMFSQREDVGAVGAKLYYPDGTIQHAGVCLGLFAVAGHLHRHLPHDHPGYMGRLILQQNLSCVTGACMMIPRKVYEAVQGLDESFEVAFNDVDLCMRIRKAGYLVVWTPFAELTHYESKTRGLDEAGVKRKRFADETERFRKRWKKEIEAGDPYYNPNFRLDREDFSFRKTPARW